MTTLCIDFDYILYAAAAIGEERSIKAVHRASGDEYEFKNRTNFWGHYLKKAGGWLAEYNAGRPDDLKRSAEEFDIIDVQTPGEIQQCMHAAKQMIAPVKEVSGASSYYGYSGRGKTFREDVSTVWMYKGNRQNVVRPVHLDELREYLVRCHNCKIVTGLEADDWCTIDSQEAWKKWAKTRSDSDKLVLAAIDKDAKGTICHLLNPNKMEAGVDSYSGFGKLWLDSKGDVEGRGRLWFYFQVLSGDSADHYAANSGNPGVKWGDKSAYKLLVDAKNDKEALQALVKGYTTIYPSPRKIIGWRGYNDPKTMEDLKPDAADHEIEVNWLYMMQENWTLAKMLRTPDEGITDVKQLLDVLEVKYGEV